MFPYAATREHKHVEAFLGDLRGTLVSDGYEAYAAYAAKRAGVRHIVDVASSGRATANRRRPGRRWR